MKKMIALCTLSAFSVNLYAYEILSQTETFTKGTSHGVIVNSRHSSFPRHPEKNVKDSTVFVKITSPKETTVGSTLELMSNNKIQIYNRTFKDQVYTYIYTISCDDSSFTQKSMVKLKMDEKYTEDANTFDTYQPKKKGKVLVTASATVERMNSDEKNVQSTSKDMIVK